MIHLHRYASEMERLGAAASAASAAKAAGGDGSVASGVAGGSGLQRAGRERWLRTIRELLLL